MLHTTFRLIRDATACRDGYRKLAEYLGGVRKHGGDSPIPLSTILKSNGLDDTLWALRATLPKEAAERDRIARLFAADCAEHVLDKATEKDIPTLQQSIAVVRRYAYGQATAAELAAAGDAAWAAAGGAAWDAAGVAAWAAAAGNPAWNAAKDAAWDAAWAAAWAAARAAAGNPAWNAERVWQAARLTHYLQG